MGMTSITLRMPWPDNLYFAVFGIGFGIPDYAEEAAEYAISFLPEKERELIKMRYKYGHSLEQIASPCGWTKQRAQLKERQVIEMLGTPAMSEFFFTNPNENRIINGGGEERKRIPSVGIGDLGLSFRAHNSLVKKGCVTLEQIYLSRNRLLGDYLGPTQLKEIDRKCREYGVAIIEQKE